MYRITYFTRLRAKDNYSKIKASHSSTNATLETNDRKATNDTLYDRYRILLS